MAAPSTKRIWERGPSSSRRAPRCSIRTRPGRRSMLRNPESRRVLLRAIAAFAFAVPATPSLAQAPGYVRVKLVKAGLMVGAGGGSGVLTYRGRDYPFRVSGLSLGVTAGASVSRLKGWASGKSATLPAPTAQSVLAALLLAASEAFT